VRGPVTTLMTFLLESWLEDFIDAASLPPINWKDTFGKDAARVRRKSEELRAEWAKSAA
jgi:hypothetical protein